MPDILLILLTKPIAIISLIEGHLRDYLDKELGALRLKKNKSKLSASPN